jgi:carboxymethylenebutenolidase
MTMCFDDNSHPPISLSDGSSAHGEDVAIRASDGTAVKAYLATSNGPATAQVVILPDVRGLHNFYRELALRFADVGMRALVIDYFGRTAPDSGRDDLFEYMPHVEQMTPDTFRQDLEAAVTYLRSSDGASLPTFTIGFCMGGSLSFQAGTLGLGLQGVIGFYAGLTRTRGAVTPVLGFVDRIDTPLLGLFGGADQGIPQEDVIRLDEALDRAGKEREIVVYPEAPHSFFDRKAAEFAAASADAWSKVQGFIADHGTVRV